MSLYHKGAGEGQNSTGGRANRAELLNNSSYCHPEQFHVVRQRKRGENETIHVLGKGPRVSMTLVLRQKGPAEMGKQVLHIDSGTLAELSS